MKVLHISNKPVYPVVDGGCLAMSGLLDCLNYLKYDIHHFCISTQKHPFIASEYPENITIQNVAIDTRLHPFQALKNLISGKSYHLARFEDDHLKKALLEKIQLTSFDLIIFDSLYSAVFINEIRAFTSAKCIIRTHNIEHKIWIEIAENTRNPLKKWYLSTLSKQLLKAEKIILNSADGLLTITEDDRVGLESIGIKTPMKTISVPRETETYKTEYSANSFYFIGSMNWEPNIDALNYLLHDIWPEIVKTLPEAQLFLVGSYMDQSKTKPQHSVIVKGFVQNLDDFYLNEGILLCPIRLGSGIRIKVLEAMSKGVPLISSSKGMEGIHSPKDCCIITDDPHDFAQQAITLSTNSDQRKQLGENAREFIRKNHSIETIARQLDEFARSL